MVETAANDQLYQYLCLYVRLHLLLTTTTCYNNNKKSELELGCGHAKTYKRHLLRGTKV